MASKIILIVFAFGIIMTSCEKKQCDDVRPSMTYKEFLPSQADTNAFLLVFEFEDCDGDIGMEATSSILDENGEVQLFNSFIDIYHLENGVWVKHIFNAGEVGLDYKIPVLSNSNLDPSLEGEIENKIDRSLFSILGYDTVMFRSRILDNAGQYSNEVETPGFTFAL